MTESALGDVLLLEKDPGGALEHYSLALKIKPADARAHGKLGGLYLKSSDARFQDAGKALEHARRACELTRYRKRDALALLARACVENHQMNEAAEAAQKTLALSISPQEVQDAMDLTAEIQRRAGVSSREVVTGAREPQ